MNDSELIRDVAEKVMGWHEFADSWCWGEGPIGKRARCIGPLISEWQPITNANHTMMLIERMIEKDWKPQLQFNMDTKKWCVIFWPGESHDDENRPQQGHHESFGHAVCLAAALNLVIQEV